MKNTFLLFLLLSSQLLFAQTINASFFDEADALFGKIVKDGRIDYAALIEDETALNSLIRQVNNADLSEIDAMAQQAFYVNAYNLIVIKEIRNNYPISSVQSVNGFFDLKKNKVAGKMITLNDLEAEALMLVYRNPLYHFVFVCGAVDCPPITNFAYRPELLEEQLEQQTRKAMNDGNFIRVNDADQKVDLSQIFKWYQGDFGNSEEAVLQFINTYRDIKIPTSYAVSYYEYDWSLNERSEKETITSSGNNANRYVVSSAIPKGTTETKIFNNLYTQKTGESRSTFFTTSLSFLYGISNRFNAGIDLRYRRVTNDLAANSPFRVLGNPTDATNRQGITGFGPKIRWAPTPALPNFSVQSTFSFPIGEDLEGNENEPYIEWDGAIWNTQLFNDIPIGDNFSVFTEIDFLIEDIGKKEDGNLNRFSTPATVILSYFPTPKSTLYALGGYSPYWQKEYDYFAQVGLGVKYQISPNFELELLVNAFTNKFLRSVDGQASTYNIGFRYSR